MVDGTLELITFDNVTYRYSSAEDLLPALDGVSFHIGSGEHVAVIGANGSGKSTMVRMINGLLLPRDGKVTVEGMCTADGESLGRVRQLVGLVFQNPDDQIVATSVEDDAAFGPENLGLERAEIRLRVDEALAAVGLTGLERREPHLLSGGQKQRLAIAGALAMNPRYLILDEPTSMLDPVGRREVLEVLSSTVAAGRAVVHVTHDLSEAMRASRVVVMSEGRIVYDGVPHSLLDMPDDLMCWGLEVPPILELALHLRRLGVPVTSGGFSPEDLVATLCR